MTVSWLSLAENHHCRSNDRNFFLQVLRYGNESRSLSSSVFGFKLDPHEPLLSICKTVGQMIGKMIAARCPTCTWGWSLETLWREPEARHGFQIHLILLIKRALWNLISQLTNYDRTQSTGIHDRISDFGSLQILIVGILIMNWWINLIIGIRSNDWLQ